MKICDYKVYLCENGEEVVDGLVVGEWIPCAPQFLPELEKYSRDGFLYPYKVHDTKLIWDEPNYYLQIEEEV